MSRKEMGMNKDNEKKLAKHAAELGRSADPKAFSQLAELVLSASPLVRRLAASVLGKLAGIVPAVSAVAVLHPLLRDEHPQVRQYSAKALGAFGADAKAVLPDLRDLYSNPTERDYVKRSVLASGKLIRSAVDIAERQVIHYCQRCGVKLEPDEYVRSQQAFQRPFCNYCFEEVFLERRNLKPRCSCRKTSGPRTAPGFSPMASG